MCLLYLQSDQLRGAAAPCQAGIDLKLFFSKVEKGFWKYNFLQDELIISVWSSVKWGLVISDMSYKKNEIDKNS